MSACSGGLHAVHRGFHGLRNTREHTNKAVCGEEHRTWLSAVLQSSSKLSKIIIMLMASKCVAATAFHKFEAICPSLWCFTEASSKVWYRCPWGACRTSKANMLVASDVTSSTPSLVPPGFFWLMRPTSVGLGNYEVWKGSNVCTGVGGAHSCDPAEATCLLQEAFCVTLSTHSFIRSQTLIRCICSFIAILSVTHFYCI